MTSPIVRAAVVQAEPRSLDLAAGVGQVIDYTTEAARAGADIVTFSETFIPGYPWWIWLDTPACGMQFVAAYAENSMTRDGEEMARIAAAATENGITISFGFSERDGGSLFMSQAIIEPGGAAHVRRKLKPTHVERSVFGEGDGSDLKVFDTGIGRVGALNCWEHLQPLMKYAMYTQHEQIHVASWPSFALYREAAHALGAEVNNAASLMYAVEGQVFVLAPCAVIGQATHDLYAETELKTQLLLQGGGFARIYGPDGASLAEPLAEGEEGILYADLDLSMIAIAKSVTDPVGHYARPDVLQLLFNRRPTPVVVSGSSSPTSSPTFLDEPAPEERSHDG